MIPRRVLLEGFLTYRDKQEFSFDGAPLWMLAGPNGVGKSAVFDAISFALYGEHRGGKQNTVNLINHRCDRLYVEYEFELAGSVFLVEKTVHRKKQTTRQAKRWVDTAWKYEPETDTEDGFDKWRNRLIGLNSDAFLATVLLRQGESEKLLKAKAEDRRKVVAQLIDLSRYKRLQEAASERQKNLEIQLKAVQNNLNRIVDVTDAEIYEAEKAQSEAKKEWDALRVQRISEEKLFSHAQQWERYIQDREELNEKLQALESLLGERDTIVADFDRLQILERTLPIYIRVLEHRKRLLESLRTFREGLQQVSSYETNVAPNRVHAKSLAEQFGEDAALNESFDMLLPTVQAWLESEQQRVRAEHQAVAAGQSEIARLESIREQRSHLRNELNTQVEVEEQLQKLGELIEQAKTTKQDVDEECSAAQSVVTTSREQLTRQHTQLEALQYRRATFESTATKQNCDLCGQPLSPEHVRQEQTRLDDEIEVLRKVVETTTQQHQAAETHLEETVQKGGQLDKTIQRLTIESGKSQSKKEVGQRAISTHINTLGKLYRDLPSDYAQHVSEVEPLSGEMWVTTIFPEDDDLNEIRLSKTLYEWLENYAEHLRSLEQAYNRFVDRLDDWKLVTNDLPHEEAVQLDQDQLEKYKAELQQRPNAVEKYEALQQSVQERASIQGQLTQIDRNIAEIPNEARHYSAEIAQRVNSFHSEESRLEAAHTASTKDLETLVDTRNARAEFESQRRGLERKENTASRLANLLNDRKGGLQLRLLQDAERAIVELANKTLSVLSGGTLRLGLREEDGGSGKAPLDLVVYDQRIDENKPIDVAYASGGQRFRIAVSLALAIGQYVGSESRRIESVIIDEGFGGLDREGRDAMIDALNDLAQYLKRVIVVSHQEDFAMMFTHHKYTIRQENGTSVVSLEV